MNPAKADQPLAWGWCSSLGLRQADLGRINGEGRVLSCTGEDCGSLTVWSRIPIEEFVDGR